MLFGASMLLVIERAEAAGQSPARVHYARMAVLLLFGLLHFYLIWHGDILVLYALTGMVAYLFRNRATKTMLIWATCLTIVTTLLFSGASYEMRRLDRVAHAATASGDDIAAVERHGRPSRSGPRTRMPRKPASR